MDMSHNYYLSSYKAGLKPFNTLASLEALYKDWESHREEWLDSTSRVDFIEGQKLLKEAIDYIKSTQNNNNNGGNTMNTNETKRITIEVEVPVYEKSFDGVLTVINKNTQEIEITKKNIEINGTSIINQVEGYIDAVIRPLLNKQPNIIFNHGYRKAKSKTYQLTRNDETGELENVYTNISYENYSKSNYRSIRIKFNGSYNERSFDIWVTPDKGTHLQVNSYMSKEDAALFLAKYWYSIKIQLNEAIEDGKQKAIIESNTRLDNYQNRLQIFENFKL